MAVVEEEPEPGAGPAVVIVTVIALIILIVILFYGLAVQHWFGFDQPATVGAAPSVTLVDPLWKNTPVPYGPLFMETDGLLTSASMHHELVDLTLLRLLAVLGVGLMALSIPSLARSLRRDPSYAFTMAVLNPVTILHLVGGAHNDALMLGLLMAGLAVARRNIIAKRLASEFVVARIEEGPLRRTHA